MPTPAADHVPPDEFPRTPHASSRWRDYFRENASRLMPIPWECGVDFTEAESDAIAASVAEFHLGESSEGRHLISRAVAYAKRTGDAEYLPALRLFMAEEHRHARDLGRVLALAGVPLVGSTWPDTVFRWLRRGAGLELSICVLVAAEIIAKVYYAALRDATGSPVLRRLCDQILRDEVQHVRFQTERVAQLRQGRPRWAVWLSRQAHNALMAGTCLAVWHKHGPRNAQGRPRVPPLLARHLARDAGRATPHGPRDLRVPRRHPRPRPPEDRRGGRAVERVGTWRKCRMSNVE